MALVPLFRPRRLGLAARLARPPESDPVAPLTKPEPPAAAGAPAEASEPDPPAETPGVEPPPSCDLGRSAARPRKVDARRPWLACPSGACRRRRACAGTQCGARTLDQPERLARIYAKLQRLQSGAPPPEPARPEPRGDSDPPAPRRRRRTGRARRRAHM